MEYQYFKIEEFYCKCDMAHKEQIVDERLVVMLDIARPIAGVPFIITSGYRCPEYNAKVGGKPNSAHLTGQAADISARSGKVRFAIVRALLAVGFKRIGVSRNFLHCDIDDEKPLGVLWTYS